MSKPQPLKGYTFGPWKVARQLSRFSRSWEILSPKNIVIAELGWDNDSLIKEITMDNNAELIANAPLILADNNKLLTSLKLLVDSLRKEPCDFKGKYTWRQFNSSYELLQEMGELPQDPQE